MGAAPGLTVRPLAMTGTTGMKPRGITGSNPPVAYQILRPLPTRQGPFFYLPDPNRRPMQLFKLIFDHDLRLADLLEPPTDSRGDAERGSPASAASLEDFLKPDPTYTRLYLSGTRLPEEHFGLDTLELSDEIVRILDRSLGTGAFVTSRGARERLATALADIQPGQAVIVPSDRAGEEVSPEEVRTLHLNTSEEPHRRRRALGIALQKGHMVLFKEQAHHGYDLHLYSAENPYPRLFGDLKTLLTGRPDQRFFSINAKRMRSERMFYFEMWTLERPPHGFEEVFAESVM